MTAAAATFPFKLEDLKSWTIKRTDGTVTKYILSNLPLTQTSNTNERSSGVAGKKETYTGNRGNFYGLADWCSHTPTEVPSATFERQNNLPLKLWVANMAGARSTKDGFHFVIDCGDILTYVKHQESYLEGDPELKKALDGYCKELVTTRHLKIDWDDRAAAPVQPQFWEELNNRIYGDVMTCCVGGHGRSGTAFVCLLLANAPDYDALDALIHCRAVHCPRAIESVAQHEYINLVAKYFGRAENVKDSEKVTNYKEAFRNSTKPTALRTKKELGWEK